MVSSLEFFTVAGFSPSPFGKGWGEANKSASDSYFIPRTKDGYI